MTLPPAQPDSTEASAERAPLSLPRVVFGSSALGNLYEVVPDERKLAIVRAWLDEGGDSVVIDSAGKYGAGMALEKLGECLRELGASPERVTIGNKLGWCRIPIRGSEPTFEPGAWAGLTHDAEQRISREGILDCWRQGVELLGEPYVPRLLSVHDPDEFLAAGDPTERWQDLLGAYESLSDLRDRLPDSTLGVGSKDWRVAKRIAEAVRLDWVMLANCVTLYSHPTGVLEFIGQLAAQGIAVVNSGVFNAGFLVGGRYFDYRVPSPTANAELFRWRETFNQLCTEHQVRPAHVCVQFGLSPAGVESVALNTAHPGRVAENLEIAAQPLPLSFWSAAKENGLIDPAYPHLGV
ncbi:Pyridoxal 4-dehydrogenase [Botrimarina colliarenosi]|uniref:Pyridoxal 4-dehydrogenase n=1 Tax=Botrimarina colliarenosi TaxID=2528001 RepID=A0A5C6AE81_9BACT|nr:aldo/keto reductase [Botrimarina colliarenosi]TWT97717.1 Pyridoxal 4-dehydrogenase [Botrimarina colliarenosi]